MTTTLIATPDPDDEDEFDKIIGNFYQEQEYYDLCKELESSDDEGE